MPRRDSLRATPQPVRALDFELLVLLVVAGSMIACGITWGLPNTVDWAIDSIAPIGPLHYAHDMVVEHHWWSKYPPLHFTILALLDAPYLALLAARGAFQPGASHYPYGFAEPDAALGFLTLIARAVSAAMGVGTTIVVYAIGREFGGRRAGLIAGLFFASSPLTLYYANTANLDIPYLFWSGLALLMLVRVVRGAATGTYLASGVLVALAVATKDQAYGLFLALPIPLVLAARRDPQYRHGERRLFATGVLAVLTYLMAANVVFDCHGWWDHVHYITHEGSAPYRMFSPTPSGFARLVARELHLSVAATTWPVAALGLVGCVMAVRDRIRGTGLLLFATLAYFATFTAPILYVFPRFVLPAVLTIAVFAGLAAARAWDTRSSLARSAIVAIVLLALLYGNTMNVGLLLDSRYAAEAWLELNLPPNAIVGMNGDPTYLPRLPRGAQRVSVDIDARGPELRGSTPDYLLMSDAYYRRYLRHADTRPVVRRLLAGDFGYEPVASFHRRWLPATDSIPTVNPRIVILRRRDVPPAAHA